MGRQFQRNVKTTAVFFLMRFVFAFAISVFYIIVAAIIQYYFVRLMGESTFNYLIGGALSLLLGVLFCKGAGSLLFMLVKGWHVAALAYANRIRKTGAPAFTVGVKAFNKNLATFGAVYGVRLIVKELTSGLRDTLWEVLEDAPYADVLKRFSTHPIVEYLASDVLHYSFDATVYYLVRFPSEDLEEAAGKIVEALKKYVCCLPSILLTSVQTYICFRFLPKVLKWIIIIWVLVSQGFMAGVLIIVLMFPIFYILDNALFDPLTMVAFISSFSKKCKEDISEDNTIAQVVDKILSGEEVEEQEDSEDSTDDGGERRVRRRKKDKGGRSKIAVSGDDFVDVDEKPVRSHPTTKSSTDVADTSSDIPPGFSPPEPVFVEEPTIGPTPSLKTPESITGTSKVPLPVSNLAALTQLADEMSDESETAFRITTGPTEPDTTVQQEEQPRSNASFLRNLGSLSGLDLSQAGYMSGEDGDSEDDGSIGDVAEDPFANL